MKTKHVQFAALFLAMANSAYAQDGVGTTIYGDQEEPIGLYISPWLDAAPEHSVDRPAQILDVDLSPIDRPVFERRLEYYDALNASKARSSSPK